MFERARRMYLWHGLDGRTTFVKPPTEVTIGLFYRRRLLPNSYGLDKYKYLNVLERSASAYLRNKAGLIASSTSRFHQDRMAATESIASRRLPLEVEIRLAERDDELETAAWLRARSFYAYPEERKFAGDIHQMMIAEEELKALKAARLARILASASGYRADTDENRERSACLIAVCDVDALGDGVRAASHDDRLVLSDDGESQMMLVGTLDVHAVRALQGEVLIGSCKNPAYLANVCTAPVARRRGVGEALLQAARCLAKDWGVDGLYVHTMAVNEIALNFYRRNHFIVESEETSNQAHYRGRCLDGIEGRGRTVLLRDVTVS